MLTDDLPLRALLLTAIGWATREQQRTIAYLIEENRGLKEELGGRRLSITSTDASRLVEPHGAGRPRQGVGKRVLADRRKPRSASPLNVTRYNRQGGLLRTYRASAA